MKILEFISDTNIGGAGVLLLNRMQNTDMRKYDTLVVVPDGSALARRLELIGVPYVEARVRGNKSFDVGAIGKYVKIMRRYKPDAVNCHGCLAARIAAKLCRVRVKICTRHCTFPLTRKEKMLARLNACLSDAFIAVAHTVKRDLLDMGVPEQKIHVIINGARALERTDAEQRRELRRKLDIGENTTVLGFCARLEGCKGHEWFLDALRLLSERDVCALLIGDGSRREHLEKLCWQYGLCERVRFCGFVENVDPLMNIVDIGINCSTGTETSSLALSEGMSLGVVSVVSDYGGNPYMIEHGVNGLVCPQGDSAKMAGFIELLMDDKELYAQMSLNARARFERELNALSMTRKTNQLYDSLYEKLS